jgi:cytoskeletal protein RodZ
MNKSVGQVLQDARTGQGLDLTEAERVTKIRVKFLRAMEEDRWEALPAPVYARSFLASYARFLGLDDEPLVEEYERTVPEADRVEPIPTGTIRVGGIRPRRRSLKPLLIGAAAVAAVLVVALVIAAFLGGSNNGGGQENKRAAKQKSSGAPAVTATTLAPGSEVSLELRSTAPVWVCLVDSDDRALLAETVPTGEKRGPFEARAFDVTFGNGSVEMTVNGEPTSVPPLAEPLGYRITTDGVHRLDSSSEPTCT